MQAVQIVAPGQIQFVETPRPKLKPGHALIRPLLLSLCGSDVWMLHHAPPEDYPFPPGLTGHEMVGVVETVDAPDSEIRVGDIGLVLVPGFDAMCEYFLAPVEDILRLPSNRPLPHYLQAQQLGTVIHACKFIPVNLVGKDVAVLGQGSAGLWFNFMLRRLGARRVIGIDLEAHRLAVSEKYGATAVICNATRDPIHALRSLLNGTLADVVIEAVGEPDAINLAHELVKSHGALLYFGIPQKRTMSFNFGRFFDKYCQTRTISGTWTEPRHASTRMAIELIDRGEIDVSHVLTHRYPFAEVAAAYEVQRTRADGAIKIVIEMPG
ncbi:MAG: zinc-binding dehydrogenase [Chloroflexi bacterium]|nr:zinc-binding dehydrogenase [Chloroflexota bacterium]